MSEENEFKVPTVNIKWDTEGGHLRINEKDFDPSIHVLWEPPVTPPPPVTDAR